MLTNTCPGLVAWRKEEARQFTKFRGKKLGKVKAVDGGRWIALIY